MLKRIASALVNLTFIALMTILICYILFEGFGFGQVPMSWMPAQQMANGDVSILTQDMMRALYLWTGLWLTAIAFVVSFFVFVSWTILDVTPGILIFFRKPKSNSAQVVAQKTP